MVRAVVVVITSTTAASVIAVMLLQLDFAVIAVAFVLWTFQDISFSVSGVLMSLQAWLSRQQH